MAVAACESGKSTVYLGEEPSGLVPAFLCAGANSVLATLWPVDSKATAKFMIQYYQELQSSTSADFEAKACAMQGAVRALRELPEFVNPYFWAAFVLYGA